ncbi:MAG: YihY/virulence factor BrkB family protein [Candidatus Eisenbacteria bacterium]|nr:YihY/virulence factor BrkB family protein [Candidatus Eisenbacteria bacterium]
MTRPWPRRPSPPRRAAASDDKVEFRTGIAAVVRFAFRRFSEEHAAESAASMAFYAVFSLFPLLLVLVIAGKLVVAGFGLEDDVLRLVLAVFPPAFADLIQRNLTVALAAGGAVAGVAGLAGLLWAAASGFSILAVTLNRAWLGARPLNALMARLRALAIVGCLVALLAAALVVRAALRFVPALNAWLGRPAALGAVARVHPGIAVALLVFCVLLLLYRLVPRRTVRWRHAAAGALAAGAGSLAATWAFTLFLASGFARYGVVYGPLGALIAFLSWVYAVAAIVLFGAYLGAAIAEHRSAETPPVRGLAPGPHAAHRRR